MFSTRARERIRHVGEHCVTVEDVYRNATRDEEEDIRASEAIDEDVVARQLRKESSDADGVLPDIDDKLKRKRGRGTESCYTLRQFGKEHCVCSQALSEVGTVWTCE